MTVSTNKNFTFDDWCFMCYGRHTKPISQAKHIDKYYDLIEAYEIWCRRRGLQPQSRNEALTPLGILPF